MCTYKATAKNYKKVLGDSIAMRVYKKHMEPDKVAPQRFDVPDKVTPQTPLVSPSTPKASTAAPRTPSASKKPKVKNISALQIQK